METIQAMLLHVIVEAALDAFRRNFSLRADPKYRDFIILLVEYDVFGRPRYMMGQA